MSVELLLIVSLAGVPQAQVRTPPDAGPSSRDVVAALRSGDARERLLGLVHAMTGPETPEVTRELEAIAADPANPLRPFALFALAARDPAFARTRVDDLVPLVGTIDLMFTFYPPYSTPVVHTHDSSGMSIAIVGRIGPAASGALPALRAMTADGEPDRAAAIRVAIARIEGRPLQPFVDAAVADLSHADRTRRQDALRMLRELWPDVESALPALEALAPMGEPWDGRVRDLIASIREGGRQP